MHLSFYRLCIIQHWCLEHFFSTNINTSKIKYNHQPCTDRKFKPPLPDLLWWNKLQQNKDRKINVCDGSPPIRGEEADILFAKIWAIMIFLYKDGSYKAMLTQSTKDRKIFIYWPHQWLSTVTIFLKKVTLQQICPTQYESALSLVCKHFPTSWN
jgi:hypothetical protein